MLTPEALDGLQQACAKHCEDLVHTVDSAAWWANLALFLGVVVAAVGSGLAGFLEKTTQRKVAAVVGGLGAVIAVIPKLLPDPKEVQASLLVADRHRSLGDKIVAELPYFRDDEARREYSEYAIGRFKDCVAYSPPPDPPALPSAGTLFAAAPAPPASSSAAVAVTPPPQPPFQPSSRPPFQPMPVPPNPSSSR